MPNIPQHLAAIMGIDAEMPPVGAIPESDLAVEAVGKTITIIRILFYTVSQNTHNLL